MSWKPAILLRMFFFKEEKRKEKKKRYILDVPFCFSGQGHLTDSHGQSTHAHTHMYTLSLSLALATLWGYPFVLSFVKFLPKCWFILLQHWRNKGHHCFYILFNYSHKVALASPHSQSCERSFLCTLSLGHTLSVKRKHHFFRVTVTKINSIKIIFGHK